MRFSSLSSSASTRPLLFSLAAAATVASTAVRFFSIPPQVVALPPAAAAANSHNNSRTATTLASSASSNMLHDDAVDPEYPGTAVARMLAARKRVSSFTDQDVNADWESVRKKILWAGGLKDLPHSRPGQGYTGHSFQDYNHVDLTCMRDHVAHNENDGTVDRRIARGNQLGPGIRLASLPELGPGGSWSTCAVGCAATPPQDVAHIQFRARIAFKLVWCPTVEPAYATFVLVDDAGQELVRGTPQPHTSLPPLRERQRNYAIVAGSKYATVAEQIAKTAAAAHSDPTTTTQRTEL